MRVSEHTVKLEAELLHFLWDNAWLGASFLELCNVLICETLFNRCKYSVHCDLAHFNRSINLQERTKIIAALSCSV